MCLLHVIRDDINERNRVRYGWKIFRDSEGLRSYYRDIMPVRPAGKWLRAKRELLSTESGEAYISGWHIFEDIKDVVDLAYPFYAVHRVAYRGTLTIGKELSHKGRVIVADEMKILERVK